MGRLIIRPHASDEHLEGLVFGRIGNNFFEAKLREVILTVVLIVIVLFI